MFDQGLSNLRIFSGSVVTNGAADTSVHAGGLQFNTTSSKIYIDGGAASATGNTGSQDFVGSRLAASSSSASFCDVKITELIVYDKLLSNSEMDDVGNYLAERYGTTWTAVS
jgi:hypothetical protein